MAAPVKSDKERIKQLEQSLKNLRHLLNKYNRPMRQEWDYNDDKHGGVRR